MTVVVGTAGHIDHGKTTLLRALTGIDADRLPEEQRRGMTIDLGYAHLDLEDGSSIDFVDVPGHDRLIGNMLVGAGEIDVAMLVVAADDGPRAQTLEHLELLDALGIRMGLAVVTKVDVVESERAADVASAVTRLLAATSLAGVPVIIVSATTGAGLPSLRTALIGLRDLLAAERSMLAGGPARLAVDRAFSVRGRGVVVTGTLRGTSLRVGDALRLEPDGLEVRIRGLQVHHTAVEVAEPGRVAINIAGADLDTIGRGADLTQGLGIESSSRMLVALRRPAILDAAAPHRNRPAWPPADGSRIHLHLGTAQVAGVIGRRGRDAADLPDGRVTAVLRLETSVATFLGDRGIVRRPSPGDVVAGVEVLDPLPARGVSRRRATPERLAALAVAVGDRDPDAAGNALVALHGLLQAGRLGAVVGALASADIEVAAPGSAPILAPDILGGLDEVAMDRVRHFHDDHPVESGMPVSDLRAELKKALRRQVDARGTSAPVLDAAVNGVLDDLVTRRQLARAGARVRDPSRDGGNVALAAAMDRLEAALDVTMPPDLADAARAAACPPEGVRALEAAGRIVRIEADLAWAAPMFHRLAGTALAIARGGTLTPAALRDATGTSRRYVMPLLEDLDRRGILARTPAGHVPGPRAPSLPPDAK